MGRARIVAKLGEPLTPRTAMRPTRIILLCGALVLGGGATPAGAQAPAPDSGAKVRVRLNSDRDAIYQGVLLAPVADSVIMRVPGEPTLRVPRNDVNRLQVGTRGSRTRSTLAGIGVGLFTGAAIGAAVGSATARKEDFLGPEFAVAAGATLLGVVGGVAGGIVGYNRGATAWHDVPIAARVGVRGVRLSIAF